jgi:hypothetical protein
MDGLESNGKANVGIDACLGVVPTTTTTIHESTCFCTSVIRIFGIEDIVDLAQ